MLYLRLQTEDAMDDVSDKARKGKLHFRTNHGIYVLGFFLAEVA